jgi:hypothetical protein
MRNGTSNRAREQNMRVLQATFPLSWFERSTDTANSLYAFIAGATGGVDALVNDVGTFGTRYSPPETHLIDPDDAMVFWAKDGDTLKRGFNAVAKSKNLDPNYTLSSASPNGNLTACGLVWDMNMVTYQSKAVVALRTIIYNMSLFAKPRKQSTMRDGLVTKKHVHARPYQSLIDNLQQDSRDGMQVQRGEAVLVVPSTNAPKVGPRKGQMVSGYTRGGDGWGDQRPQPTMVLRENAERFADWGGEFRQMGRSMSMSTLASIVHDIL